MSMYAFILIVIVQSGFSAPLITSVRFENDTACNLAQADLKRNLDVRFSNCYPASK
jgi:hypothetical protein